MRPDRDCGLLVQIEATGGLPTVQTHATDRADALDAGVVKAQGITLAAARAQRSAGIPAGRYGTPAEFGAACAFLCSQHAGFIVGQNILLDGGATNATI